MLLVGGDLTRDGSIHRFELEEAKADLDALPFPAYVVPGNMDTGNKHTRKVGPHRGPDQCNDLDLNVTSAQLQQFASVYGPLWWSVDQKLAKTFRLQGYGPGGRPAPHVRDYSLSWGTDELDHDG